MNEFLNHLLEEEYGLHNIRLVRITQGLIDANYKVTSAEGTYFFKVYRSISAESFAQLHHDLKDLNRASIPVPVEIPRKKQVIDSERFHALYEFVAGESYSASVPQIKSAAVILGKLIQLGREQQSQTTTKPLLDQLAITNHQLKIFSQDTGVSEEVRTICRKFQVLSGGVQKKLFRHLPNKLDYLPLHPDFTERNLLFMGDAVVLLCDWQGYGSRILLDELASAFTRFCTIRPFEGYLLEERLIAFRKALSPCSDLISSTLHKSARLFPWLLIHRQIRNMPFRVQGLSGPEETEKLLLKALLWSNDFVEWIISNEMMLVDFLLE